VEENVLRYERSTGGTGTLDATAAGTAGVVVWGRRRRRRRLAWAGVGAAAAVVVGVLAVAGGLAAGALGLVAIVTAAIAFARPYLLGPVVALMLPGGYRYEVLDAHVSALEAVVGGGALGYVVYLTTRPSDRRVGLVHCAFAAFVVLIFLSTLGPADDSDQLRIGVFWGALGFVFHAVTTHLSNRREVRLLLAGLVIATFVEAGLALEDYIVHWSDRYFALGGAIVYPLPNATLVHPNALAMFLVLAVLAIVALALAERGVVRGVCLLVAGAGSLALVTTFSRASWIAFAAGAAVYLLDRRTRIPVVVVGAVTAVTCTVLILVHEGAVGARIASLWTATTGGLSDFRLQLAEKGASIAAAHPLTGAGHFYEMGIYAGRFDFARHPHNLFLGLAVFFGIPAALAFAALVVFALRAAHSGIRRCTGAERLRAVGLLSLLVAFLVNGLLEYPFWNWTLCALIVLLLATVIALDPVSRREHVFARRG
jgi:O-antigen ligase